MKRYTRTLALLAVALLAVGAAFAAAAATADAKRGKGPKLLGKNVIHVDVSAIGRNGQTRTLAIDKGKVSAKGASSVTITRADNVAVSLTVDANTKIRSREGQLTLAQLAVGAEVVAFSSAGKALLIGVKGDRNGQAGPKGPRGGHKGPNILRGAVHADINVILVSGEKRSQTLDRGEVTAVSSTSVTIKRPDGPSVTLAVNADTKIRKRGQGSLAAGDRVEAISRNGTALVILAHGPRRS